MPRHLYFIMCLVFCALFGWGVDCIGEGHAFAGGFAVAVSGFGLVLIALDSSLRTKETSNE